MVKAGKKKAVVPKLRFPEFAREALSEVRLSDVTAESSIRNGDGIPAGRVMGVSKVLGIVPMEERIVASDIARYKLVRKDWFAYNPMRLNIGSIARWHGDDDILVSPDYVVFRCSDDSNSGIEPSYLDHFRQSAAWDAFVSDGGDGGVRVRIYYKDIARLELALPQRAEQQKIADCLSSLDELIAAQGRKVEALKTYKRGLVQQLFPREGETLPRLRFPEFRDAPEWDKIPLGDIAEIKLGKMLDANKHKTGRLLPYINNISLRWNDVDTSNLPQMYFNDDELERYGLKAGDVLVCEGGQPGRSAVWDGRLPELKFQKAIHRVRFSIPFEPRFLVFYLEAVAATTAFESLVTGGGIRHLTLETFSRFQIPSIPLAEQRRVTDFLSSLSGEIAAEVEKLGALKNHKKGLMQQLFPSLEEA